MGVGAAICSKPIFPNLIKRIYRKKPGYSRKLPASNLFEHVNIEFDTRIFDSENGSN